MTPQTLGQSTAAFLIASGAVLALGMASPLHLELAEATRPLFWDTPDLGAGTGLARLGTGVAGAVCVGWGIHLFATFRGLPQRTGITAGLIAWFVVDGAVSIASGGVANAVMNLVYLVPFLVALSTWSPEDGAVHGAAVSAS